ncbi:MAG: ATP-binding protein [Gemmatimonadaceae bacterium]
MADVTGVPVPAQHDAPMTQAIDVTGDISHPSPTEDASRMVFLRTLGAASIDAGATHLTPASVRKFALFVYLWSERGRSQTRATLHDMIFPDQSAVNARHSIRELVYQFRKLGVRLASAGETIELALEGVRADYSDILRQERPSLDQLRDAAGGFLPGYAPEHSEAFTEWLEAFRRRAAVELNRVFVTELNRARKLGDWTLADAAARAVLALDPLHEEATLATAELLAISGAKAEAVTLLDRYAAEVGTRSPELRLPAALLRRRISERSREIYRAPLTLPFLGRDAEMSALQERFERAKAGEAQCAVIVGEAGIGKTRLAEEMCTQAVLAGASVARVATQPHDVHRPMATFADLVPKLLELPGALGCAPESMTALRRLTTSESDAVRSGPNESNSEIVAGAISRALADLVDAIATEAPLVIFVDDAQWTDERSRQTVAALSAARHARRLLIVLTSRDRSMAQFLAQRSDRAGGLALAPLTSQSSRELTSRALAAGANADTHLQDWIAWTSGGNPFFLKCLIGHFQTTGERFVVPTSLSALLDQTVGALSGNAAMLLGTCVALGRHSEVERVLRALEMPQIDLQLAAAELEASGLIAHVGSRVEAAHALVREAATRLASPLVLRLVHRRVATVLEAEAETGSSTVLLWDCAEHWAMADEPERAADFLKRCATRAGDIGRPREAAELLLRASAMVARDSAIQLAREAVEIAHSGYEADVVRRGVALLRQLGFQIESDVLELAELHTQLSLWDDPEYLVERLRAWIESSAPLEQRVAAATCALIVAEVDGQPELAAFVNDRFASRLSSPDASTDPATLTLQLIYHCAFGDMEQVPTVVGRLLSLTSKISPIHAVDVYRKCAIGLWRFGHTDKAIALFRECFLAAKTLGLRSAQFDVAATLMTVQPERELQGSEDWLQVIDALVADDSELATRPTNLLSRLERACLTADCAGAKRWLEEVRQMARQSRLLRTHRWIRAAELNIRQLEGDLPSVDEAESLIACHRPGGEAGEISDFEIGLAYSILRERGEIEIAEAHLAQYLGVSRRSRSPVSSLLRLIIASRAANGLDRARLPTNAASCELDRAGSRLADRPTRASC